MSGAAPWWSDRDPGDEDDDEPTVEFVMDPEFAAALNDEALCPKGHPCEKRDSDGALWCHECDGGTAYFQSIDGLIPRRDAA